MCLVGGLEEPVFWIPPSFGADEIGRRGKQSLGVAEGSCPWVLSQKTEAKNCYHEGGFNIKRKNPHLFQEIKQ